METVEQVGAQLGLGSLLGSLGSSAAGGLRRGDGSGAGRLNIDVDLDGGVVGSGGMVPALVQLFREVTGTECTPPSFVPPAKQPTTLIGQCATLSGGQTGAHMLQRAHLLPLLPWFERAQICTHSVVYSSIGALP